MRSIRSMRCYEFIGVQGVWGVCGVEVHESKGVPTTNEDGIKNNAADS